jgi:uncharacterized protein YmfQ (DUF2313 family)
MRIIKRTAENYRDLLMTLLPKGRAWNRETDSVLAQLMHAKGEEFALIDGRMVELRTERDTRLSSELLVDHEEDLGLPDECSSNEETITERRFAANSKLIEIGALNKQYYIDLASDLGWTIEIEEFTPFWSGVGVSGDPCGRNEVIFNWKVWIHVSPEDWLWIYFTSGSSSSGDPLIRVPGTETLLCILKRSAPAHTRMLWEYIGPEFGAGFDDSFDSIRSDDPSWLAGEFNRAFASSFDVYYGGGDYERNAFDDGFYKQL